MTAFRKCRRLRCLRSYWNGMRMVDSSEGLVGTKKGFTRSREAAEKKNGITQRHRELIGALRAPENLLEALGSP